MKTTLTTLATACDGTTNPLCGIKPDPTVFGVAFQGQVNSILSGLWFLVLAGLAGAVLLGLARWGYAARVSHNPDAVTSGSEQARKAGVAFGVAAAATLVLSAILTAAGIN